MRIISPANATALAARQLVARDFLWIVARTYDTGVDHSYGFHSGVVNVLSPVINPDTGLSEDREFEGSGALIAIGDIPLVADMTAQQVEVTLSQISEASVSLVRGYDMKQARIEIYRGLYSPETRKLVDPAYCRFVGFVDDVDITTPSENDVGSIALTCVSHSQEAGRKNTDTRSDESQKRRNATDNFYQDTTTVGDREIFWGGKSGKIETVGAQRIGSKVPSAG